MADSTAPTDYPNPLEGYEHLPALSDERNPDGKSLLNPARPAPSPSYTAFPSPITSGFDVHVYFTPAQLPYARALHTRIRHEFPELRAFRVWEAPVGPHPCGMFEVDVKTPGELGALMAWLVVWRAGLSVLVHPHTTKGAVWDHDVGAVWLGEKLKVDLEFLRRAEGGA
ncbi:MAG: hypothetical protein M1839_001309 [Geoglossum umbratile]|nr:MAG: hypothetical protein M1839_001309 [Geoglossum umbratile]